MTQLRLDAPTDEQTFRDGLVELLDAAEEHDVHVERAWDCAGTDERWEVEVVPLDRPSQSEQQ